MGKWDLCSGPTSCRLCPSMNQIDEVFSSESA